MKKLITKDKKLRVDLKNKNILCFILQSISQNSNFSNFTRWKAAFKLRELNYNKSKSMLIYKCAETINKKRFNKLTLYSRHSFLKLIRSGKISGFQKAVW